MWSPEWEWVLQTFSSSCLHRNLWFCKSQQVNLLLSSSPFSLCSANKPFTFADRILLSNSGSQLRVTAIACVMRGMEVSGDFLAKNTKGYTPFLALRFSFNSTSSGISIIHRYMVPSLKYFLFLSIINFNYIFKISFLQIFLLVCWALSCFYNTLAWRIWSHLLVTTASQSMLDNIPYHFLLRVSRVALTIFYHIFLIFEIITLVIYGVSNHFIPFFRCCFFIWLFPLLCRTFHTFWPF